MEKSLIIALIFLFLTQVANASPYLDMLKDLNVKLLCILIWITPPLVAILLIVGSYLLISGTSPERRAMGKNLIQNSLIGMLLVIALIGISVLIADLDLSICY